VSDRLSLNTSLENRRVDAASGRGSYFDQRLQGHMNLKKNAQINIFQIYKY